MPPHKKSDHKQHEQRKVCPHATGILQPLADIQADDVKPDRDGEKRKGAGEKKCLVLNQVLGVDPADVGAHGGAGHKQSGKIKERINPIRPPRDKAVKIAEGFFGPDVKAAFMGEAGGKLGNNQSRGHKEEKRGDDPQADGRCAIVGGSGDPARTQHRGDVEQQYVPQAHLAAELFLNVRNLCRLYV